MEPTPGWIFVGIIVGGFVLQVLCNWPLAISAVNVGNLKQSLQPVQAVSLLPLENVAVLLAPVAMAPPQPPWCSRRPQRPGRLSLPAPASWVSMSDNRQPGQAQHPYTFTTRRSVPDVAAVVGDTLLQGTPPAIIADEEIHLTQAAFEGTLTLAAWPQGDTTTVEVHLDSRRSSAAGVLRYLDWRQQLEARLQLPILREEP